MLVPHELHCHPATIALANRSLPPADAAAAVVAAGCPPSPPMHACRWCRCCARPHHLHWTAAAAALASQPNPPAAAVAAPAAAIAFLLMPALQGQGMTAGATAVPLTPPQHKMLLQPTLRSSGGATAALIDTVCSAIMLLPVIINTFHLSLCLPLLPPCIAPAGSRHDGRCHCRAPHATRAQGDVQAHT